MVQVDQCDSSIVRFLQFLCSDALRVLSAVSSTRTLGSLDSMDARFRGNDSSVFPQAMQREWDQKMSLCASTFSLALVAGEQLFGARNPHTAARAAETSHELSF